MSVQTQIDRINAAKADILAALTEKGVDTTGAGLADIAGLVAGIESGGGGGDEFTIVEGNFTPSSDITGGYTIEHNLGKVPKVVTCYRSKTEAPSGTENRFIDASAVGNKTPWRTSLSYGGSVYGLRLSSIQAGGVMTGPAASSNVISQANEKTVVVGNGSNKLKAGYTYYYIVAG